MMTDKLNSIWREVAVAYSRPSYGAAEYKHTNPVNVACVMTESQPTMLTCWLVILRQEVFKWRHVRPASHLMPTHAPHMGSEVATGSWTKSELAWIPHIRCRTKTAT
jgi:hypothetical protein